MIEIPFARRLHDDYGGDKLVVDMPDLSDVHMRRHNPARSWLALDAAIHHPNGFETGTVLLDCIQLTFMAYRRTDEYE
jgi:hypothetical protein